MGCHSKVLPNPLSITQTLAHAGSSGLARIDAQRLLLHALGRPLDDRAWLLAHDTDALSPSAAQHYLSLCQQRASGVPVAYLTGCKEFYGLTLQIDARVLDPRPDTETLVDWALETIATLPPTHAPRVADLGTGSGAIALALQHQYPAAQVLAVDASADALAVAQANGQRLKLPVQWLRSDWLAHVSGVFDLIVSNPPYIAAQDPHLAALTHEPLQALASGADGLDDIRTIIAQAPGHLRSGGWLLLEHGYDQAAAVTALLQAHGFTGVTSRADLAGIARCTGGQWLKPSQASDISEVTPQK
jgi:release factor glutamine methyltransferase